MNQGRSAWLIDDDDHFEPAGPNKPRNDKRRRPEDPFADISHSLNNPPSLVEQDQADFYHELDDLDRSGRVDATTSYSEVFGPTKPTRRLKPDTGDDAARDFDIFSLWNRLFRRNKKRAAEGPRLIYVNDPISQGTFKGNHISTTKYNIATFLPKFLFEQFSKYANLFFFITGCIQQVPHVSPTNRYTTFITLLIVLLVSAAKEAVEDFKRRRSDRELNDSKVYALDPLSQSWQHRRWVQIKVGDIVRVENKAPVPADLVLLASSEPKGLCYIETSNLDGETNLKIKQSREETSHLTTADSLSRVQGRIESELPNSSLYTYEGTLKLQDSANVIPLSTEQLLLRGTTLRNTQWIHGLVVFTGHETKLMRNATATPIKRTAVEHMINLQIMFLFAILIVMAVMSAMGNVIRIRQWREPMWYLQLLETSLVGSFFRDLLTFWILFSNLIPISLFVTVEVIKFYQAFLISNDLEMYYEPTDTPAVCRTSSLVEELGQIQYIFSDKTGTLTRNVMEFKGCYINDTIYTNEMAEDKQRSSFIYKDFEQLADEAKDPANNPAIAGFFTLLATCHTVIPEVKEDMQIKYQSSSPDEGALVEGAAKLGFVFTVRKPRYITIEVHGREIEYELLNVCEFNSTRKRMSAILRCPDGRIRLFCKGADTVIFERLCSRDMQLVNSSSDQRQPANISAALEEFATQGLRTLCLATREIPEKEYLEWSAVFDEAAVSLHNRNRKLDEAAEIIEVDLELLGASAVEDKLQDGVPETIHSLQSAGIKIWVLTGDRQETAINIGMSCKLLSEDMNLLIVNENTRDAVHDNILKKLDLLKNSQLGEAELDTLALVIDGVSLGFALEADIEEDFLDLAVLCRAVICCRVSPLQKAMVVKLVKRHLKALLLAVGDGANDVSMIQAAHVGVGIAGLEGQQAARSADVSIGQFRYLERLLLVHGSWSYSRLSRAILYSFYKNIALYLTQFWYVFFNGFSGQSIYESWTVTFYNVVCTSLPPFCLGIFDQYISARHLRRYPQLYKLGQKSAFLSVTQFWQWIMNGIYHSIIIFFFSFGTYHGGNQLANGRIANHWTWGTATFTACAFTALFKAAIVTNMWNKYTLIGIPGSALIWLAFFPPYATVAPLTNVSREYMGVLKALYSSLVFWAFVLLVPVACILRDVGWKYYRRMYFPQSYHYVQEIQKYKITDTQPHLDQFQNAIRKVRQIQRMQKQRGYAFSQADEGMDVVIRAYDTSKARKPYDGHLQEAPENPFQ